MFTNTQGERLGEIDAVSINEDELSEPLDSTKPANLKASEDLTVKNENSKDFEDDFEIDDYSDDDGWQ